MPVPEHQEHHETGVVAWRLTQLENSVKDFGMKLDNISNGYPTHNMVTALIDPLNREIRDIKKKHDDSVVEKNIAMRDRETAQRQLKIAMFSALISPIFTYIVAVVTLTRGAL